MLPMFSRGFKDIITKTAKFKEFPGLENKCQNSRGFKEIKDTWEPCIMQDGIQYEITSYLKTNIIKTSTMSNSKLFYSGMELIIRILEFESI